MKHQPSITPLGVGLEVVLLAALTAPWVFAWRSIESLIDSLPPGNGVLLLSTWSTSEPLWGSLVLCLVSIAFLAVRHWIPLTSCAVIAVAVAALGWWYPLVGSSQFTSMLVLVIASFWAMWKTRWFVPVAILSTAALSVAPIRAFSIYDRLEALGGVSEARLQSINGLVSSAAFAAIAAAAAWLLRRLDHQQAELAETNQDLRASRAASSRAAVLDERVRISRELHDVVAHHVTTMTVNAGAARQVAATNPDAAVSALRQIEEAGRAAVTELHRLLGFLRDDKATGTGPGEDRSPTPSLRHLDHLTNSIAGISCDVSVTGDLDSLPQSVDVSAYRIVQESLTNVMKHSSAHHADVDVQIHPDRVAIIVNDAGQTSSTASHNGDSVGGHGLVGMRERVALHDGQIKVGPSPSNPGWTVHAELPFAGSSV